MTSGRLARGIAASVAMVLAATAPARAQWPAELVGWVVDAGTGGPVEAAVVEIASQAKRTLSDGAGAFRFRGLEPGAYRLVVKRLGYAERTVSVQVRNGRRTRVSVRLTPVALPVEGVAVSAEAAAGGSRVRIEGPVLERAAGRSVGDVLARVSGVVVRRQGAGGPQTVSIRGAGADAVLVLLDGAPLNDPVTGEADLSTVPADAVERITVLKGGRPRYGPRAEAGVIIIESRVPEARRTATVGAGSLGEWRGAGEWGGRTGGVAWGAGGRVRTMDGAFAYTLPGDPDGASRSRKNADLTEWGASATARSGLMDGELQARLGYDALRRGLPGKAYAPSPRARQDQHRLRGMARWQRSGDGGFAAVTLSGVAQRMRVRDPAPPFGTAYDDTTDAATARLRVEWVRSAAAAWIEDYGAGLDGRVQRITAGSLAETAPVGRTDIGGFVHGRTAAPAGPLELHVAALARLDRDGLAGRWYGTHALTVRVGAGALRVHASHRSSYSPPALGDQFFRAGVAVAPNPDLQPERVPSEFEVGIGWTPRLGGLRLSLGVDAYRGDVRGMIVWAPDFRFVWSPRNMDVRRRGLEARFRAAVPEAALRLSAAYARSAVTYDRPGDADTVQVMYRPRESAHIRGEWTPGRWTLTAAAHFTGRRNTAPAATNALPSFWTFDLHAAREWQWAGWRVHTALRVDRLLDSTESLIFGYPEPGRRLHLEARLQARDT